MRRISETEREKIEELAEGRYRTWEWTYGTSPEMTLWNEACFVGGVFSLYLRAEHGVIQSFRLCGDFFEIRPVAELERLFAGVPLKEESLSTLLEDIDCGAYIEGFSNRDLRQLICAKI